jgi:hypothetical protein
LTKIRKFRRAFIRKNTKLVGLCLAWDGIKYRTGDSFQEYHHFSLVTIQGRISEKVNKKARTSPKQANQSFGQEQLPTISRPFDTLTIEILYAQWPTNMTFAFEELKLFPEFLRPFYFFYEESSSSSSMKSSWPNRELLIQAGSFVSSALGISIVSDRIKSS